MRNVRLSFAGRFDICVASCVVLMLFFGVVSLNADESGADLVAPDAKVQKLADGFTFTEGPAVAANGDVYFTDIPNNRIHKWSVADQKLSTFREDSGGANGLYFARDGNLYACQGAKGRVASIGKDGKTVEVLADKYNAKGFNKPNDLWIDSKGGVYFTDPNYGRQPHKQDGEHVYYLSPDRKKVVRVVSDMKRPNGIIGTTDGKLYIADPGSRKTYRYKINEDGTLSDKKLFVESGSDGMTLDSKGNLYITRGEVKVFSPDGKPIRSIAVPEGPSNVCFGGKDGKTLFITARKSFYSIRMAVAGMHAAAGGKSAAAGAGDPSKLPVKEITIKTVTEMMRYDIREFTVRAGQRVKLIFQNVDYMPHNLMIVNPGMARGIALKAEKMGEEGFIKHFRPDDKNILWATKMLDYEDTETLEFVAPSKPGEYDYICTFPMHWMMMRGMMHVVGADGKIVKSTAPAPKRTEWKFDDLAKDLPGLGKGHRSFEEGKTAFNKLGCVSCHKIKGEGGAVGPDLTEVFKRWKGKREDVLREILEPSKVVQEKFRSHRIETNEGLQLFGFITERKKDHLMIVTNPTSPKAQKVMLEDIAQEQVVPVSVMPKGLLATLDRHQILNLLAYLEAGADPKHKIFSHSHKH